MLFRTNVALAIKGDRIEPGQEVELTDEEAAAFDPADITALDAIPADGPEEQEVPLTAESIDAMSAAQLKEAAAKLELSTAGTKADLQERLKLAISSQENASGNQQQGA